MHGRKGRGPGREGWGRRYVRRGNRRSRSRFRGGRGLPPLCRSDTAPKQKQAEQQGKEFDHGGTSFWMEFYLVYHICLNRV